MTDAHRRSRRQAAGRRLATAWRLYVARGEILFGLDLRTIFDRRVGTAPAVWVHENEHVHVTLEVDVNVNVRETKATARAHTSQGLKKQHGP